MMPTLRDTAQCIVKQMPCAAPDINSTSIIMRQMVSIPHEHRRYYKAIMDKKCGAWNHLVRHLRIDIICPMPGSLMPAAGAHAHLQCQSDLITPHHIKLLIDSMSTSLLLLLPDLLPIAGFVLAETLHS